MPAIDTPRAVVVVLLAFTLAGGIALRDAVPRSDEPSSVIAPTASPSPAAARALPSADAAGADLEALPRFPGSVRVGYHGSRDERLNRVAARFLTDAGVDEVRAFYQEAAAERGWRRADVDYTDGGWSYVLVKGRAEAHVLIEPSDGLVSVRLEVSRPIPAVQSSPPAVQPAAPPPDNGGDDDDDDDDDGDDDDEGDDDDSDGDD